MSAYDPEVHSQIHSPDEKPVHIGWYPAVPEPYGKHVLIDDFDGHFNPSSLRWWFWNGMRWMSYEKGGIPAFYQNRYWFGLRRKP